MSEDRSEIERSAEEATGKAKKALGAVLDDDDLREEGSAQQEKVDKEREAERKQTEAQKARAEAERAEAEEELS